MRDLKAKRVVVKVGTNTLCKGDGTVDVEYIEGLADQVIEMEKLGIQTIIVTSGAIGSGSAELGLDGINKDVAMKQACAAVGQGILMMAYRDIFKMYGKSVGQVLLTYGAFSDRVRYLNLKKAIEQMFDLGVVPIVNENDVIATDEIEDIFGDNDKLSALVASKIDADLLIILTDVDGLYDRNPLTDENAKLLHVVDEITPEIERMAGGRKNERSTGGMRTKINAAKIAMASGCNMVIANGAIDNVIIRIVKGEEIGTLFTAKKVYTNKQRWILFASPKGRIDLDEGAQKAVREGRSLLACGVTSIDGKFKAGEVVRIGSFAKGISKYSAEEMAELVERCRSERGALSKSNGNVVVENVDIMFTD
ncbi:MAG: glutamate 5-kinase [Methanomassiliicoccales archaeon]|nr:MAG: glutamate 5-kinase [Methanomassiliicoccales archaeon]